MATARMGDASLREWLRRVLRDAGDLLPRLDRRREPAWGLDQERGGGCNGLPLSSACTMPMATEGPVWTPTVGLNHVFSRGP